MEWTLIICSTLIIMVGYTVVRKVENSRHQSTILPKPEPVIQEGEPFILIFGRSEHTDELIRLLQEHDIDYIQIEDQSQLDNTKDYTHLFALSISDLDNLLINTLVNRINKTHKKFAVCNNPDNQGIYRQSGINCLGKDNLKVEIIFQTML